MSSSTLPHRVRRCAALLGAAALGTSASAQIEADDLFVVYSASGNTSSLVQYDVDGGVVNTIDPVTFQSYTAAALTPDGNFVINKDSGFGMEVRAQDGTLIDEFLTPLTLGSGSDVDVFDDGAVAICSRGEGVQLYDQTGVWLGSFEEPGMESVFGCYHTLGDTLWVVDRLQSQPALGHVYHFDRAGTVLAEFDTDFGPSDIVQAGDGTLWMSDFSDGRLVQYSPDGVQLGGFDAVIDSAQRTLWSLAISPTGDIIAQGHYDSVVRYYGQSGVVLNDYPTTAAGNPLFMFSTGEGGVGTPFCFGDGSGSPCPCGNTGGPDGGCKNSTGAGTILTGAGNASVSLDVLTFTATGVPANQPALLFAGLNNPGGGDGIAFGDGLRCAGMNVTRLGVKTADSGGSASWGPGLGVQGGWLAGDTRYFQSWYRDPNGSPCGQDFNLSNGVEMEFYD